DLWLVEADRALAELERRMGRGQPRPLRLGLGTELVGQEGERLVDARRRDQLAPHHFAVAGDRDREQVRVSHAAGEADGVARNRLRAGDGRQGLDVELVGHRDGVAGTGWRFKRILSLEVDGITRRRGDAEESERACWSFLPKRKASRAWEPAFAGTAKDAKSLSSPRLRVKLV